MARAGKALKCVLIRYGISQNQLATVMGIDRSNVSRWVSESRDPSAEAVAQIKQALNRLQPAAAEDFVQAYLYEGLDDDTRASDIAAISRLGLPIGNPATHDATPGNTKIQEHHLGQPTQIFAAARFASGAAAQFDQF